MELDSPTSISAQQIRKGSLLKQASVQSATASSPAVRVYLRGPNLEGVKNETVELEDDEQTVFAYLQQLLHVTDWGAKTNKYRSFWEPTYTLLYTSSNDEEGDVSLSTQSSKQKLAELEKPPEGQVEEVEDVETFPYSIHIMT